MLGAQRDVRRDLLEAVRLAALRLRDDDRYPALLDHFEAVATRPAGRRRRVERDPSTGGGVVASADGARRLHAHRARRAGAGTTWRRGGGAVDVTASTGAESTGRSPTGRVEWVNGPVVHLSGLRTDDDVRIRRGRR